MQEVQVTTVLNGFWPTGFCLYYFGNNGSNLVESYRHTTQFNNECIPLQCGFPAFIDCITMLLQQIPGRRLYTSFPRMCGLKLEENVSYLGMEVGKQCPPIWVYF